MGTPASPPTPCCSRALLKCSCGRWAKAPLFVSSKERMSAVTSKVRIYDLAKDLKIDTKRLIEEVRREGVDVSVPSNSISKELAEKIRDKYFPKKDAAVKRTVKIVKKAARPVVEEAPPAESEPVEAPIEAAPPDTFEAEAPATITQAPPVRVVRKLSPAMRAEKPAEPEVITAAPEMLEPESAPEVSNGEPVAATPVTQAPAALPPSRQVRVLRPTAAALNAGIRHGERAPAPPPAAVPAAPATAVRERGRARSPRGRV